MPARFVFRQIDRRDLEQILADGEIRCKTHPQAQLCYQTSHASIVGFRGTPAFQLPYGGVVNDYVQFYFSPVTAYSYVIHQGNVEVKDRQGNRLGMSSIGDRIFLVASVASMFNGTLQSCFSDYALNSRAPMPTVTDNYGLLPTHVKWPLFDDVPISAKIPEIGYGGVCHYFADQTVPVSRQNRKSARMAECLVKGAVPTSLLCAIVTPTANVFAEAVKIAGKYGFGGKVLHKPGCFV